jgi:voltage-gated potassium channel Kch
MAEKYTVSTLSVDTVLGYIKSGEIAIPEIQRPFVWKAKQVRDLIDSLYTGYPTGYLIISQNPDMKLKDGSLAVGKKIMIDGQQRTTALMTAIVGMEVITENFGKRRYKISFNPLLPEDTEEERFKVQDNATIKDKRWIADIAEVFSSDFDQYSFIEEYRKNNPEVSGSVINNAIMKLLRIKSCQIGVITLDKDLTIDEVTEIFIRINSQGAKLNQSDFAMSKIAANVSYGGNLLRKGIDYFSHLAAQPDWYSDMCKDTDFKDTEYFKAMQWLKDDKEDIFDPNYGDILRIAFMYKFGRGKMKDLVSLLGGRDFETREYKEEIAEASFGLLKEGVLDFMNRYSFTNFLLAIKSAGFITPKLINSSMTLDFAYTLFLLLHSDPNFDKKLIDKYVTKWYVLTTLTSRYIGSPETVMDYDLRSIKSKGFIQFFAEIEAAELSETFWNVGLVQRLETSAINSPYFNTFIAAQIHNSENALFSKGTKISDLITIIGDVHHIFPKQYLIKNGWKDKATYNQIANYTYLDTQVNKDISDDAPYVYFGKAFAACDKGEAEYGNISIRSELTANLEDNCIPIDVIEMEHTDYPTFLEKRRKLMAKKIQSYYNNL